MLKIDDPVGAVSVHGVYGAWGVIALGLFADGTYGDGWNGVAGTVKGLFYGDSGQFFAQCIGTLTNIVYVFAVSYVFFWVLDKVIGLRVPRDGTGRARPVRGGGQRLSGFQSPPALPVPDKPRPTNNPSPIGEES